MKQKLSIEEFLTKNLEDWINDSTQYGKDSVKKLILVYIKLYIEAINNSGQKAIDTLTYFYKGFPENPETECLSSYIEFIRSSSETKDKMREAKNVTNPTLIERKNLMASIINTYSKGVEFIGKILTTLILLMQASQNIYQEAQHVYNLFFSKKIKLFKELSAGKYDDIIKLIYREIRNADAHLGIYFQHEREVIRFKVKRGNKIKISEISVKKFMLDVYPCVGWLVQAYLFSTSLLILAGTDELKFKTIFKRIYN